MALALSFFSACRKDADRDLSPQEVNATNQLTIKLSLEASVENDALRAVGFQVGVNTLNQLVPIPKFNDGQQVPVHTIVRGNNGAYAVKTINWKYSAEKGRLVLEVNDADNDLTISNFNNDTEWYVSGLIGGELDGTTVKMDMPTRALRGVTVSNGVDIGEVEVPFAFGWTKLKLHTQVGNSFQVGDATPAVFKPRGAFIGYKLGNKLADGYTFTPTGFTVTSDAFGDKGSFELNSTPIAGKLPEWTEARAISTMTYTLATSVTSPYPSNENAVSSLTYYAWVMPTRGAESGTIQQAKNRIMLKGMSSKYAANPQKDYTKTYYTDYLVPTVTNGKVRHGRVHRMTARATQRVFAPIEYVTEFNLAGGSSLSSISINGIANQQPEGIKGSLRFSNFLSNGSLSPTPYKNDQSGYYAWSELTSTTLQATFGAGKYFIPEVDHMKAAWPIRKDWTNQPQEMNQAELIQIGANQQMYRHFLSDYSANKPVNNNTENAVFYAIRFKQTTNTNTLSRTYYGQTERTYQPLLDNTLKCAYRYTRVGGADSWNTSNNQNMSNHLRVDVVYLGEEEQTDLSTITNDSWWNARSSQTLSRIFPAAGFTLYNGNLQQRGFNALIWTQTMHDNNDGIYVDTPPTHIHPGYKSGKVNKQAIRLFKTDPDVE